MREDAVSVVAVAASTSEAERIAEESDLPGVGSWWWVSSGDANQWFGCVVEVGSNYAVFEGLRDDGQQLELRLHLDEIGRKCTPVARPHAHIEEQVNRGKRAVRDLMRQITEACARLGVPLRSLLTGGSTDASTALAIARGSGDARAYGRALADLKDRELPDLFEKVKNAHARMAAWMRADLIPASAELARAQEVTRVIQSKIETVEIYAGLEEQIVQARDGNPAPIDARVHLMQRMCFMDEECLARYEAGGMDFKDVSEFDRWIAKSENMNRILPHPRCIVAFRVRRHAKAYDDGLHPFIRLRFDEKNRATYLYVRNGEQLHRVDCPIQFEEELFPRRESSDLLGDEEIWVRWRSGNRASFIGGRERAAEMEEIRAARQRLAFRLWAWRRSGKPEGDWERPLMPSEKPRQVIRVGAGRIQTQEGHVHECGQPSSWSDHDRVRQSFPGDVEDYVLLTPDHAFYEDAMREIRDRANRHNRIAVLVQGLLDRSTCLHPHPPWRLWTPDGFAAGVDLVYDASLAIPAGEPPDFNAYRKQLNQSFRVGSHAVGQKKIWYDEQPSSRDLHWHPKRLLYMSGGPSQIHRVSKISGDRTRATFRWDRKRQRPKWIDHPDKPGYLRATYPPIPVEWSCPIDKLTCVDAYTPGDFHLFYDDPRTRADYLSWAPILLACEDWHARRRGASGGEDRDEDRDEEEVLP